MIKNLPEKYLEYINELANKSLKECILPENWKTAQMTMIPKKGSKSDPNNYRSISLTSCIGKLIEKLIENRLSKYLKKNNILINEQSGFRKLRRTTDNLLFLTQKVKEQFNRKKKVCTLFFDISKAFDKVWHAGLLYKLKLINTPQYLINWIRAFLTNRKFCVKINDKISTTEKIEASTPQGAISISQCELDVRQAKKEMRTKAGESLEVKPRTAYSDLVKSLTKSLQIYLVDFLTL